MSEVEQFHFRGQNPNEEVLLVIHRHPIILLNPGYVMLLLLLIPWVVFVLSPGITGPFAATFLVTLLAAGWIGFTRYYMWKNDVYVITDRRVIATNQRQLLARTVSEVPYDKVQEISHEVSGLRSTMLNVGDVIIKTASADDLVLRDIYDPYEVEQKIAKYVHV